MKRLAAPVVLALLAACNEAPTPLTVADLPQPPNQRSAWTPPVPGIPTNLLSAAESLFDLGFPDPRGCEYRDIELTVSGVWQATPQTVATRGWVLPEKPGEDRRHAICWNGLVYPIRGIGEVADLHAEATGLVPPSARRFNRGLGEITSVYPSHSPSSRVLLLLRCGEVDAALTNWVPDQQFMIQAQAQMNRSRAEIGTRENYDPFLELAGDWAWAQFDRILCAHMRGDVALALVGARELAAVQPGIEAEAERRGFARPGYSDSLKHETPRAYLYFLDQLSDLRADLERRARKPKDTTIIERGLTNVTRRSRRVAALIEDLDMVQAQQMGQPGRVPTEMDPIVQALIDEGDAAVDPLIKCLDNDGRLTRSVGFSRDFTRNRVVIPVSSAARGALRQILRVQFRSASEFRAYWRKNKGAKIEDRWYATLKDDNAGTDQWLQAAWSIMQPDNVRGVPGSGHYRSTPVEAGQEPAFRGEVLRAKRNPSVTELLLKRAEDAAEKASRLDQSMGVHALREATAFVTLLSDWDSPSTAVPPARSMMRRGIRLFADNNSFILSSGHDFARYIPRLTQVCVEGGDTNALSEYGEWIRTADALKLDPYTLDAFEPIWRNPTNAVLAPVADALFNDPASPWCSLPWKRSGFDNPLASDLIKVPAFRRLVFRELGNHEIVGTVRWRAPNSVAYDLDGVGSGSRGGAWPEFEHLADGVKVEIRRCDWIAWQLSVAKHIPFFNPFDSVEARDTAIEEARTFLRSEGRMDRKGAGKSGR